MNFDANQTLERIIDGKDIVNHIPWQVSIQRFIPDHGIWFHFCGGTILNQYTILSAAHCFHDSFWHPGIKGDPIRRYEPAIFRIVAGTPYAQTISDKGTFPHVQASFSIYLTFHSKLR